MFIGPALVALALVLAYPVLYSIWLSFTEASLATGELRDSVRRLRQLPDARERQDGSPCPRQHALLCSRRGRCRDRPWRLRWRSCSTIRWRARRCFRVLLILPWAIAPVANARACGNGSSTPTTGSSTPFSFRLGVIERNITWLATPFLALNCMLLVDIWKSAPFIAILLLAALQGIPQALYRAAAMDGAKAWQQLPPCDAARPQDGARDCRRSSDNLVVAHF